MQYLYEIQKLRQPVHYEDHTSPITIPPTLTHPIPPLATARPMDHVMEATVDMDLRMGAHMALVMEATVE